MTDDVTPFALPGVLREIAEVTDVETALAVARTFGGKRLFIPKEIELDHPLIQAIGIEPAWQISRRLGGDRHIIPSAVHLIRCKEARRLKALGFTNDEIGAQLGITRGQVGRLVSGRRWSGDEAPAATAPTPSPT
jgi:hypothetical protein